MRVAADRFSLSLRAILSASRLAFPSCILSHRTAAEICCQRRRAGRSRAEDDGRLLDLIAPAYRPFAQWCCEARAHDTSLAAHEPIDAMPYLRSAAAR
jgi:hypothetical protein